MILYDHHLMTYYTVMLWTAELLSEHVTTRVASLEWIGMAHEKDPMAMDKYILTLLPALLGTLSDTDDEVVLLSLQVLASISFYKKQFLRVLNSLVVLFEEDRALLETRGALVIRKLCVLLDSRSIYLSLSDILNTLTQLDFVSQMVQTLNLLLLTAPELISLRKSLKNCFDGSSGYIGNKTLKPEQEKTVNDNNTTDNSVNNDNNNSNNSNSNNENNDNRNDVVDTKNESLRITTKGLDAEQYYSDVDVFTSLFNCWSHNSVATFSLCLLAQAYDLSAQLISRFADVDVTVGFLMQVDKLVQLLESPIFIHLRLQLLEVTAPRHYDLLKSLYGLLMVSVCACVFVCVCLCACIYIYRYV